MRWLGIKQVTVETAGSTGQGALVRLIGLEDVESFRNDVLAQRDALRGSGLPESDAKDLRKLGFGAAAIAPADGIMRGWGAVVSTAQPHADPSSGDTPIHRARAFQAMGFATSNWSSGTTRSTAPRR